MVGVSLEWTGNTDVIVLLGALMHASQDVPVFTFARTRRLPHACLGLRGLEQGSASLQSRKQGRTFRYGFVQFGWFHAKYHSCLGDITRRVKGLAKEENLV